MIGLSAVLGGVAKASGLPSISINSIRGLGGGAARDAARLARLKMYDAAVDAGSVTAARYMLGQADHCVNDHERDWYNYSIQQRSQKFPELFAEARRLGPLLDRDDAAINAQGDIERELTGAVNNVRGVVAGTVARIGSGAVTAATAAIGGPTNGTPVTIPTSRTTLVIVAAVVLAVIYFVAKRK